MSNCFGNEYVISIFSQSLSNNENPEIKFEILKFFISKKEFPKEKSIVEPLVNCLTDKSREIRNLAEIVFEKTIENIGIAIFINFVQDLKPVFVQQLKPLFEKYSEKETNKRLIEKTPKNSKLDLKVLFKIFFS